METIVYRDKGGQCLAEYPYLQEPIPTMDCFCTPEGCTQWDRLNDRISDAVLITLLLSLVGAAIYAFLGGAF